MIEGVAGPESANNAAAGAAMIPLFALGIPGSSTIAIIMGAFLIHGVLPGPFLFVEKPEVVWPIIASFVVGNAMLLALNVPLIPLWVSLLKIPYSILFALILAISVIGTYSASASFLDVGLMILSGVVGFIFMKLDYPIVPLLMGFILGPLMEKALRQSLALSAGDYRIFVEHPISAVVLAVSALALLLATVSRFRGTPGTSTAT